MRACACCRRCVQEPQDVCGPSERASETTYMMGKVTPPENGSVLLKVDLLCVIMIRIFAIAHTLSLSICINSRDFSWFKKKKNLSNDQNSFNSFTNGRSPTTLSCYFIYLLFLFFSFQVICTLSFSLSLSLPVWTGSHPMLLWEWSRINTPLTSPSQQTPTPSMPCKAPVISHLDTHRPGKGPSGVLVEFCQSGQVIQRSLGLPVAKQDRE